MERGRPTRPASVGLRLLDQDPEKHGDVMRNCERIKFTMHMHCVTRWWVLGILTISPSKTTFSPRMRKRPTHCSANTSWWYILSTVSSNTRLATLRCQVPIRENCSVSVNRDSMGRAHQIDHKISRPQTAFYRPVGRPASFLVFGNDVTNGLFGLYLEAWDGLRRTVDAIHQRPRSCERDERVHAVEKFRLFLSLFLFASDPRSVGGLQRVGGENVARVPDQSTNCPIALASTDY